MANKKFKAGDAFFYGGEYGVFILTDVTSDPYSYIYRYASSDQWKDDGSMSRSTMVTYVGNGFEPHPDPDSVWAEYTAWRLTQ